MKSILVSLFSLGWLDFFSPSGLAIITLIASMVKKKTHLLIYIISSYVAYCSAACAIYFGIDRFLTRVIKVIGARYPLGISIVEVALGLAAGVGGILLLVHLIRKWIRREKPNLNKMIHIQSAAPWFLILFSFCYVWGSIYACYPLLGFIGVLTSQNVPFGAAVFWLMAFCMFSISYKLIIFFFVIGAKNSKKVEKILNGIGRVMTVVLFLMLVVLLFVVAGWLLKTGLPILLQ